MAPMPDGTFSIGSADGPANEKPVHDAPIVALCMDTKETTVAQYAACVRAHHCTPASKGRTPTGL